MLLVRTEACGVARLERRNPFSDGCCLPHPSNPLSCQGLLALGEIYRMFRSERENKVFECGLLWMCLQESRWWTSIVVGQSRIRSVLSFTAKMSECTTRTPLKDGGLRCARAGRSFYSGRIFFDACAALRWINYCVLCLKDSLRCRIAVLSPTMCIHAASWVD